MHLYDLVIGLALLAKILFQKMELNRCICLKLSMKLWYFMLEHEGDKVQLQGAWRWMTDAWRCFTALFLSWLLFKYLQVMFLFSRVFGVPLGERGQKEWGGRWRVSGNEDMFYSCPCVSPGNPTSKAGSLRVFLCFYLEHTNPFRKFLYLFVSLDTYTLG